MAMSHKIHHICLPAEADPYAGLGTPADPYEGLGSEAVGTLGGLVNTARAAGIDVGPYEVAMILASVKLARMSASPSKRDNYLDAINYLAFAAELIGAE